MKKQPIDAQLVDALNEAYAEVETLAEELQGWLDSIPENLQGGDKASTLQDSISTLEGISEVELPECAQEEGAELRCQYFPLPKKYNSRAARCSWAAGLLAAASEALLAEANRQGEAAGGEDPTGNVEALEQAAGELQDQTDELEGVEFPGMYG